MDLSRTGNNMAQSIGAGTVDGGTDVAGIDKYQGKVVQLGSYRHSNCF